MDFFSVNQICYLFTGFARRGVNLIYNSQLILPGWHSQVLNMALLLPLMLMALEQRLQLELQNLLIPEDKVKGNK